MLCEYGCGKEALYKFKNGKICCSIHYTKCPIEREKLTKRDRPKEMYKIIAEKNRGSKRSNETRKKIGAKSKIKFRNKEYAKKNIERLSQYWGSNHSEATRQKMSISAKKSWTNERKKKLSEKSKKMWKNKKLKDKQKQYMLDGGATYANKFIKNPSRPQVELFKIVQEVFPYCYLNYPCLFTNYNIDIAIPKLNIAIEYDGSWWHQNKEKDKKRQKELEDQGWIFIRYEDYIPTKKELMRNFNEVIK